MSTGSTGSIFPKWQLAVLLGAPIAIGIGYLYFRRQTECLEDEPSNKTKKSIGNLKGQTISLDGDDKLTQEQPENVAKKAVELSPLEVATAHKNEGNVCFKKGKYDEAIEWYDKAIEVCPSTSAVDLSTFYQNRAAAYEQLKKWTSVRDDCTKALELNSKYVKALHRRARAYEHLNDFSSSLEDVTATCILESFQNNSTLAFADRILKQMGRNDARKAMETRQPTVPSANFIKTYFASFTNDPIRKVIVASTDPKGFVKAKMALDAQKYDEIIPACTEEIESSESESEYKMEATLLRGTFYLLTGLVAEALADFDTLIKNDDINVALRVNALIKKASLNVQSDNADKGFEYFSEAEKLDSKNADIYHQRGQVYILLERLEDAVKEFAMAVKLAPEQGMTYIQKCYAEYRLAFVNQNQVALFTVMNDFNNAITKFPDCVESYSVMAQVLTEQQQFDQADSFFDKAIKISPNMASLYVHRGIMQLQWNGDVHKAVDYMHTAIKVDEKCELAFETLGTIEVQRGNLERAVELFEKALKLAKSEPEMVHLYALRNAAVAQINVAKKLGIDMSSLSALASGMQ